MKTYIVTYDIKRNRVQFQKSMEVTAINLKMARNEFDRRYFKPGISVPHPFHIRIKLKPEGERAPFVHFKVLRFKVTFNVPEFDAIWRFVRDKSAMYGYGNKTAVTIFRNDELKGIVDTRYDKSVLVDFRDWCMTYMSQYFDPSFEPNITEIEEENNHEAE